MGVLPDLPVPENTGGVIWMNSKLDGCIFLMKNGKGQARPGRH